MIIYLVYFPREEEQLFDVVRLLITGIVIAILGCLQAVNGFAANWKGLKADGQTNTMPVHWSQTSPKIIVHPDQARLERREVLCQVEKIDAETVMAQTVGLIQADPGECFKVIRKYNQYVQIMPDTVESRVIRSFRLEGDYGGAEAVDFWTRLRVLGFGIGYLLRIAHLSDPEKNWFRSFWTLVDNPTQIVGICDSGKTPCENDLAVNLGSHQFEHYPRNPAYALHTYTVIFMGKSWLQRVAFQLGGQKKMREVTEAIRKALVPKAEVHIRP
jgi:hypothetical protein